MPQPTVTAVKAPLQPTTKSSLTRSVRVNLSSLSELKGTLDDHLKLYLTTDLRYIQNHTHSNVKLVLGYVAALFAGGVSLYTYLLSYEKTVGISIAAVVVYFVLNSVSMAYSLFVEKDIVFEGVLTSANSHYPPTVYIRTTSPPYTPQYTLSIRDTPSGPFIESVLSMALFFDETGLFVQSAFEAAVKAILLEMARSSRAAEKGGGRKKKKM